MKQNMSKENHRNNLKYNEIFPKSLQYQNLKLDVEFLQKLLPKRTTDAEGVNNEITENLANQMNDITNFIQSNKRILPSTPSRKSSASSIAETIQESTSEDESYKEDSKTDYLGCIYCNISQDNRINRERTVGLLSTCYNCRHISKPRKTRSLSWSPGEHAMNIQTPPRKMRKLGVYNLGVISEPDCEECEDSLNSVGTYRRQTIDCMQSISNSDYSIR